MIGSNHLERSLFVVTLNCRRITQSDQPSSSSRRIMRLLLLAAIVTVGCANPMLGGNKCTYGPSYWCSHIKHAKDCGALEHCMTAVWKFNPVQVKSDAKCEMCTFAITEARKLLQDHATQKELTAFLKKACMLAPTENLRTECSNVVKEYLPEILKLIASDVQPKLVCTVLGLCTTNTDKETKVQAVPAINTKAHNGLCDECKALVGDLENKLKDPATQAEVEALLDQLCMKLGPLEATCKDLVKTYLPQIFDMLTAEFDPNVICRMLGFCTNGTIKDAMEMRLKFMHLISQLPKKSLRSTECDICKEVIAELQRLDRDKATQEAIENLLENKMCTLLGALADQCKELVKDYAPLLFEFLASELDPNYICKALKFCTQTERLHAVPIEVNALTVVKSYKLLTLPKKVQQKKNVKASPGCILCEFIMQELDSFISKNSSQKEVINALETVCGRLPDTIRDECKSFVDEYGPAVIALLVQELDPAVVCQTLGLCSKTTVSKQVSKVDGALLCEVCTYMMGYLDSLIKKNATIQEIEAALEKVCNFLPSSIKTECDSIVQQYSPVIAQLVAQLLDPTQICREIGLCGNAGLAVQRKPIAIDAPKPRKNGILYFQRRDREDRRVVALP